jgi:hypothetical protein
VVLAPVNPTIIVGAPNGWQRMYVAANVEYRNDLAPTGSRRSGRTGVGVELRK